MLDQAILFIDKYFLWIALAVGIYKVLHIVFYKGMQPKYIFITYFVIFSGMRVSGAKDNSQRVRFRQTHNALTVLFYFFLVFWLMIHLAIGG